MKAALDGDCLPPQPAEESPGRVLTVRLRARTGYDTGGNPTFEWRDGPQWEAFLSTVREEADPDAGVVRVVTSADVVTDETVPETSVVRDDTGVLWRVIGSQTWPGRQQLEMERLD